jgi:hypothetical protein
MTILTAADYEIDDALWAAYRRYDKAGVTENLLYRYLPVLITQVRESRAAAGVLIRNSPTTVISRLARAA